MRFEHTAVVSGSPVDGGRTQVKFRCNFPVRPRWLAWLIEPLARAWFSRETRLRVVALADALRPGADIPRR